MSPGVDPCEGMAQPAAGDAADSQHGLHSRRWIVVGHQDNPVEAAIVNADTEQAAAEAGANFLWQEALERADGRDWPDPPTHVFVAPWDVRVAYATEFSAQARPAELQCCGGGPHAEYVNGSGHWGGCPIGPKPEDESDDG